MSQTSVRQPPLATAPRGGWGPPGKVRSPLAVILLSLVTLGFYSLYWQYQVFKELKDHTGDGIGGIVGLVVALLIGIVNLFVLPSEVGNMYAKAGQPKPVRGVTGFWILIPLLGFIVWTVKVQGALNRRWRAVAASS